MKVQVVAYTVIGVPGALEGAGYHLHEDVVDSPDELAEFADRHYHQCLGQAAGESRPDNRSMLDLCIFEGNTAIFDHASATILATGASWHLGWELNNRFFASGLRVQMPRLRINENNVHFVIPEVIAQHPGLAAFVEDLWEDSTLKAYAHLRERLIDYGHDPDEATRVAECIFPSAIETSLLISGSMSTWRHVTLLALRAGMASDEAVRFATKALVQLKTIAPNTFQDR